jgi:haloalkane dehalogenase
VEVSEGNGSWPDRATWTWPAQWAPVTGGRLHYVRAGAGPRVVLVHGTPTWSYEWRHVLTALSSTHEVVAADHLGFGLSDRPDGADYSPEAHAHRFGEAMATLAPWGPVALVVHDFGGPIALRWALDHRDRLSHVVVVNSWLWPLADDPQMARAARMAGSGLSRLLYRYANASLRLLMPSAYGDRRRLTRAVHGQYLAAFPEADSRERVLFALAKSLAGSSAFYGRLWSQRERLAGVPVTLLWGMADSALKPALLEKWRTALPHARVHTFADAGHWPHEERPQEFVKLLAAALARDEEKLGARTRQGSASGTS